jgi:hypothetical protein
MLGEVPAGTNAASAPALVRARAAHGFRVVVSRQPKTAELDRLVAAFVQHRDQFRQQPERARQVIGSAAVPGIDAADQAAWTLVANALLNLDETITKD